MSHIRVNLDTEVLEIRVLWPVEHVDTVADRIESFIWPSNSEFDHLLCLWEKSVSNCHRWVKEFTYLLWRQLVLKLLVGLQDAKLHGKLASLGGFDERQLPVLKLNVVLDSVEVEDRNLALILALLLVHEGFILCVSALSKLGILGETENSVHSRV